MNNFLRSVINSLAEDIITEYKIQIPIRSMEDVVHMLGGTIRTEMTFFDGEVVRDGDGFLIKLSPFQDERRKRFTIAHELGHLFLHMGYMTNERIWSKQVDNSYRRTGNSEKEYQANEFAAAFLMPRKEYLRVLEENTKDGRIDISNVAEYFNVSVDAAANRGKFLGCIKW